MGEEPWQPIEYEACARLLLILGGGDRRPRSDPVYGEGRMSGADRVVILDGPMGTELERRGVAQPLPGWSAHALDTAPDLVAAIHRDYAAAGATVHTANTFRTKRRSVGARWRTFATRAIELAQQSVGTGRVAGALAPLEDCYRPDRSPGLASRAEHGETARVLAAAGADLLLCETFASPLEALVAVEEAVATGLPTWVSLLPLGVMDLRGAARACVESGAQAVLVNCVAASQTLPLVRELTGLGVPFGAYANAGDADEGLGWGAEPVAAAAAYARLAASWIDAGATIVGGCCGTGPAHIAQLAGIRPRDQGNGRTSTRP